jgi:syntaxin 16
MYRDRTNLFISYRQSYTHHPQFIPSTGKTKSKYSSAKGGSSGGGGEEEELGLITHTDENDDVEAIEMDRLPPAWIDLSDEVDEQLGQIDTQIARLGTLHRANALPGFDDRTAEEAEIERLTFAITAALHRCQALIKRFADLARRGAANAEEERMSTNMRIAMATRVQVRSTTFRKMQSNYLKSLRKEALMTTGSDPGSGVSVDTPLLLDSSTDVLDADIDESFSHETLRQQQEQQQQQQTLVTHDNETVLRQREEEITKIATGILELSEIFKDLQTMVIDQGTLLDRIDYNVENMHTNVKQADKELVQATHYQKRTQKCKIILLLSLLVLGLFIILLIKPKRHHYHDGGGSSAAPPPSSDHNNAPDAGYNRYLL